MSEPRDERGELLDRTLRAMVSGEGPGDLRRRVLARLEAPRRRRWLAPAWAAVAAAVVAVALLLPIERRGAPPRTAEQAVPPAVTREPAASPTPAPAAPEPPARVPVLALAARASDPAPTAPSLPPLPDPEPITIAALEPGDLALEPLAMDPLVLPSLAMEPLTDPEPERKE
jgi:hypothetical protein